MFINCHELLNISSVMNNIMNKPISNTSKNNIRVVVSSYKEEAIC